MRSFIFVAIVGIFAALAACKNSPKGQTTPNGYIVENFTNKGGIKAQPGDIIKVHVATYVGDSLMQDTRQISPTPRELPLPTAEQLAQSPKVPALIDGLTLIGKGDSAVIYQQVDSLIEKQLPKELKKEKFVKYVVVLYDVISKSDLDKKVNEVKAKVDATIADYTGGKLADKIKTTASGLKVYIVEQGSGAALTKGENIKTEYYGALMNGDKFDSSFERNAPLEFPVGTGNMIPGFDEGAMLLNHGGKAYFFLPSKLAYGESGAGERIPPNSDLLFYVEVL